MLSSLSSLEKSSIEEATLKPSLKKKFGKQEILIIPTFSIYGIWQPSAVSLSGIALAAESHLIHGYIPQGTVHNTEVGV